MALKPDDDLDQTQLHELNMIFYKGDPAEYFARRLRSLVMSVADSDLLRQALREGLTFEGIEHTDGRPYDEKASLDYAAIESTVLLHHAIEALLRLYIAHREQPRCPWLKVARVRGKKFNDSIEELVALPGTDPQYLLESLRFVFRGGVSPDSLSGPELEETWNDDGLALTSLVLYCADRWLSEGSLYNAAKHGLALIADRASFTVGVDVPQRLATPDLPCVQFMETTGVVDAQPEKWQQTYSWVDVTVNIGVTHLVIRQINALWSAAHAHYLGRGGGAVDPLSTKTVEHVLRGVALPYYIARFSSPLHYTDDEESGHQMTMKVRVTDYPAAPIRDPEATPTFS